MRNLAEMRNASECAHADRLRTPVFPGCSMLRRAVRENIVSFPSQIPVLLKQPAGDMQWRAVLLFFVRGWHSAEIAARFNVPKHRVWKGLNDWSVRALALGYVQVIDPEAFAACCRSELECEPNLDTGEIRPVVFRPLAAKPPHPFADAPADAAALRSARPQDTLPARALAGPPGKSSELIAALDTAIAHCDEWRDEFWVRTATLLRDLRTVAAAALDAQRAGGALEESFTVFESRPDGRSHGLHARGEERVSHAVA